MKKKDNVRKKALIKLAIWSLFILLVLGLSGIKNPKTEKETNIEEKEKETTPLTYAEKLAKLNNNYNYVYKIKINDLEYEFIGEKLEPENTTNIKEHGIRTHKKNNTIVDNLEYYLENGYVYEIKNGGLFQTDIDIVYENINKDYLDISKIKEMILNKSYTNKDNDYIYNLDNYVITIITDELNVREIKITINNDYYDLILSNIGQVKEIKY